MIEYTSRVKYFISYLFLNAISLAASYGLFWAISHTSPDEHGEIIITLIFLFGLGFIIVGGIIWVFIMLWTHFDTWSIQGRLFQFITVIQPIGAIVLGYICSFAGVY